MRDQISRGSLLAANYGRIRRIRWRFTVDPQLVKRANEFSLGVFDRSEKTGKMDMICRYIYNPFPVRRLCVRHACFLVSLLLAVIKNPRVTFYRCSTVVSLLVSCGSVSWISCFAFRNGNSSGFGERLARFSRYMLERKGCD